MRFSPEATKKTNMKKNLPMLQDIFLTTRQCLMLVRRIWFSENFVLPNALLTYLKNVTIFWHKQQTEPVLFVSALKVKILVRKKLRLIPQKSHKNSRDYNNKYTHSTGHWNNQSIVPINSWKSNHVRDVVLTKRCGNASKNKPFWSEKGLGTPFPRVPDPLHPLTMYSSM